MIYILLNAPAILAAALAGLIAGTLWLQAADRDRSRRAPRSLAALASVAFVLFVGQAWLGAILAGALILAPPRGSAWTMALGSAFVIWIGFVAPVLAATGTLRGASFGRIVTDAVYWLIVMLVQAAMLQISGLQAPPA